MTSEITVIDADQARAAFLEAVKIDHRLLDVLHLAGGQQRADLPSVERWVCQFNQVMNCNAQLESYRKQVFTYLLRMHNLAVDRAAERERLEAPTS